jgi:hypothetical protein
MHTELRAEIARDASLGDFDRIGNTYQLFKSLEVEKNHLTTNYA